MRKGTLTGFRRGLPWGAQDFWIDAAVGKGTVSRKPFARSAVYRGYFMMRNEFLSRPAARAAALNCLFVLSLTVAPRCASRESDGATVHHRNLSTEDSDASSLGPAANKNVASQDAASIFVEEDHYGWHETAEGERMGHGTHSWGQSSLSTSPRCGKLSRSPAFSRSTGAALRTLVVPALSAIVALFFWQLGDVLLRCLTRAGAWSRESAAGSGPRSLSDSDSQGADFDAVCANYDLDPFMDVDDSIPLTETSLVAVDDFDPPARSGPPGNDDEIDESRSNARDVLAGAGSVLRKAGRNKILRFLLPGVVLTIFAVLIFVVRPSRFFSRLAGNQTFVPLYGETAAPSSDTNTSAPTRRSASFSSPTALSTSSSTAEPTSTAAAFSASSPSGSLSSTRSPASSSSSSSALPRLASTSPSSAASSSAPASSSSPRGAKISSSNPTASPAASTAETSSPSREPSSPPAAVGAPTSYRDVPSTTSLSTGVPTTAVKATGNTSKTKNIEYTVRHVPVDCTVRRVGGRKTCYAKLVYNSMWGAVYPSVAIGNVNYQFGMKDRQQRRLSEKGLLTRLLEEFASQIKEKRDKIHEGCLHGSADKFRLDLTTDLVDINGLH